MRVRVVNITKASAAFMTVATGFGDSTASADNGAIVTVVGAGELNNPYNYLINSRARNHLARVGSSIIMAGL